MSLAVKLTFRIVALVAGVILVGTVSLWGLAGLSRHFDAAEDEYQQLRAIYEIGHHAALAKTLIHLDGPDAVDITEVREQLSGAMAKADTLLNESGPEGHTRSGNPYHSTVTAILDSLQNAYQHLSPNDRPNQSLAEINMSLGHVAEMAGRIRVQIIDNREQAKARYLRTVITVTTSVLVLVPLAIWMGIRQYSSVMRPLRRLEQGVQRVADGHFTEHLPVTGDHEFARLSERFNAMADQLNALYRRMDEQVKTRSQQLVRSQRLASVGFLAAGLAHEINNPLGIIAGHAEAAAQRLGHEHKMSSSLQKIETSLRIISDEAFRCKDITSKLLSLSSPAADQRARVRLAEVADRVVKMLSGLPRFRAIDLTSDTSIHDDDIVHANEGQLTQVLVNLVTNALEAVDSNNGKVMVHVDREDSWLTVRVEDDGRGMTEEVTQKIFEPFFTDKPQRGQRGTGLGLSVAHAIIEQHGGQIDAHSDGPNMGSIFTVRLPVVSAVEEKKHA